MEYGAICSRRMLLSIAAAAAMLGHPYIKYSMELSRGSDVLYLITLPMATSMFGTFAAVFPALPYSLSFAEDYNTSYFRFLLIRKGRKRYVLQKIFSVAASGAVMMTAAFGIIFLIAVLYGEPTTRENVSEFYKSGIWYSMAPVWGGKLVLLLKLILAAMFGAVWSSFCLLLSALTLNRYVAFIGTFILYQFLWQAMSSSVWNPIYLLRADIGQYGSFWEPAGMQALIFAALAAFSYVVMSRRVANA